MNLYLIGQELRRSIGREIVGVGPYAVKRSQVYVVVYKIDVVMLSKTAILHWILYHVLRHTYRSRVWKCPVSSNRSSSSLDSRDFVRRNIFPYGESFLCSPNGYPVSQLHCTRGESHVTNGTNRYNPMKDELPQKLALLRDCTY